jgi:hypothetical protein
VLDGDEGARVWAEAGRPLLPSLVIDGTAVPVLHRSQIASLLALPDSEEGPVASLAWDCAMLLDAWLGQLQGVRFETLLLPTRSRRRSIRNLTVNVFHPFELLPDACVTGVFPWDPDGDAEREAPLVDRGSVVSYAQARHDRWTGFLDERCGTLDPLLVVGTPRGELTLAALLGAQRWHAAFHYRQLVDFLEENRVLSTAPLPLDRLDGLDLPVDLY